jgi:hypothetical protein
MSHAVLPSDRWWRDSAPISLDASDESDAPDDQRYCPIRLLCAFALLMAGHGCCVNTSMMLGDRQYAMWQLARAHTLGDAELREVSARLFAYFDDERAPVPVGLRP